MSVVSSASEGLFRKQTRRVRVQRMRLGNDWIPGRYRRRKVAAG